MVKIPSIYICNQLSPIYLVALFLVLTGCATSTENLDVDKKPLQVLIPIFYSTDRNIDQVDNPSRYYGTKRGEPRYGLTNVALSTSKQGNTNLANWRHWSAPDRKHRNSNHLEDIRPMSNTRFKQQIIDTQNVSAGDRSALVYIHGSANTFDEAAIDLAILTYEIDYQGTPILYSWPAGGTPASYTADIASMDWSTYHLRKFLQELITNKDLDTVHIIAHSLGNSGLLKTLEQFVKNPSITETSNVGEVILFSADIDADIFRRDLWPSVKEFPARVTLYVSTVDVPLQASEKVNRYQRLGDASDTVFIEKELQTIDMTEVTSIFNGHTGHVNSAEVQTDLYHLITGRQGANERSTTKPIDTEGGRYWEVTEP